jgi:Putative Ig domain/FG-GAP repeat
VRRPSRAIRGRVLLPVAIVLTVAAMGQAVLPQQTGKVDLLSQASLRIDGATANDAAGRSVAAAGDVNGDGLGDVLVGAPDRDFGAGAAYVVFGRPTPANVDLGALGGDGFRINGAAAEDSAGRSVAGAGDVNGDGLADIVIGAELADNNGRSGSGSAYVVFGRRDSSNLDLSALGPLGFRIDGAAAGDDAGASVAGAGDLNADGLADVLVGANGADPNGEASGSAYVVFGRRITTTVDLAALGSEGFRMDGAQSGDFTGSAVAAAGDVSGDGRPDVLVGAFGADNNARSSSGSVYLVFGQEIAANVELSALGRGGFRIDGAAFGDSAGDSLAPAGDLNADGRADILVGASRTDNNGRLESGSAYVVFGQQAPTNVDLSVLGGSGVRIDGAALGDFAGSSVAAPGDLDGDGRRDIVVGASGADNNGRLDSGSISAAGAPPTPTNIDLSATDRILRIDGATTEDNVGVAATAGDVNGDGRPDIVVGSGNTDNNDLVDSGSAYVIYGFGAPELSYPVVAATVGTPLAVLPATLRRTGPASFSVSPALPAGLTLDASTGEVAGRPTDPSPRSTFTVTMTDLAGSVSAPLALQVTAP